MRARSVQLALLPFLAVAMLATAEAAERHFTFGYDQPHTTAYGYAADVFFAVIAFCILFPDVVLWLPKQVLPESVGCFKSSGGAGYICP